MIKETAINYLLAASIAGGGVGLKFYADHTYIAMNDYEKSKVQERIWVLNDRKRAIKREAAREGRELTTLELQDIEEIKEEIKTLKEK